MNFSLFKEKRKNTGTPVMPGLPSTPGGPGTPCLTCSASFEMIEDSLHPQTPPCIIIIKLVPFFHVLLVHHPSIIERINTLNQKAFFFFKGLSNLLIESRVGSGQSPIFDGPLSSRRD